MPRLRPFRFAVLGSLSAALGISALPSVSAAERTPGKHHARRACPRQKPQPFLIRSNFVKHGALNAAAHEQALRYRAEQYGSIEHTSELQSLAYLVCRLLLAKK